MGLKKTICKYRGHDNHLIMKGYPKFMLHLVELIHCKRCGHILKSIDLSKRRPTSLPLDKHFLDFAEGVSEQKQVEIKYRILDPED